MLRGIDGIPHAELPCIPSEPARTNDVPQPRIVHRTVIEGSSTSISTFSPTRTIYLTVSQPASADTKRRRTPGLFLATSSKRSLKSVPSSDPMKANEMDAMNMSDNTMAMTTMKVGPRGMTPARGRMIFFKLLTGSESGLGFALEDLECAGFVLPAEACVE